MLKIGIGPSSSHTLGPWRAAEGFVLQLKGAGVLHAVTRVRVELYGSLALTGRGHGTDIALIMGLTGADPVTVPLEDVHAVPQRVRSEQRLNIAGAHAVRFEYNDDIVYHRDQRLPGHANGMIFSAVDGAGETLLSSTAYSIGGGFVVFEGDEHTDAGRTVPHDVSTGAALLACCRSTSCSLADIARENELAHCTETELDAGLAAIWRVMREAVHRGCSASGILPGGLEVHRRAPDLVRRVTGIEIPANADDWFARLENTQPDFARTLKFVGAFSIAVNEENAAFGRIVTAPTNGSAGVIPAVLLYYRYLSPMQVSERDVYDFLLVAGLIGGIFKTGATISAAMGGCQAEIGVSSAMAAAALTEGLGGSPEQAVMAAEIAMEHHLGLTCDPIGGLVQIPCIERNSMGAIKAITAAHIALESESERAKVSLDAVVKTMWETAQDMNTRYKETSLGGLAVNVAVSIPEC
ncbi:MAG: L-serine ammonia-lyase [Spirochaetaceae bacterium]|nr:MAG: L-serine ammonia-lyase [Spirochaetaceae bacterium]